MQPTFRPPATDEEYTQRAAEIDSRAAKVMVSTLNTRRAELVKTIDEEIAFYTRILKERGVKL